MNALRLHDPLWLAAALPVLVAFVWWRRQVRERAVPFSSLAGFDGLQPTLAQRLRRLLPWTLLVALLLLVAALARPQRGREEFRVRADGIAIQLVIDRSGSMAAMDFEGAGGRVDRLGAVKDVVARFVGGDDRLAGRPDDAIGLVVFGGYAESRCPLTLDHDALLKVLRLVELPGAGLSDQQRAAAERLIEGDAATAIGDALALAVSRLAGATHKSRIVILLSDGENNAGVIQPAQAAALARSQGVKVYTIGIGSTGMAPFPVQDFAGRVFLRQQAVVLDERTLGEIAAVTGGRYFNARSARALEEVYRAIDELEKTVVDGVVYTDYRELYGWLLLPALGLIVLEALLSATRFRTLP